MLNPLRLVQMWFSRRRNNVKTLIYWSPKIQNTSPVIFSYGLVPFERYFISFQLDVHSHTFVLRYEISSQNELREESGL